MKISVIMSVYNEPLCWLEQSIDSVLNQTIPVFEFIIVNDNPDRVELNDFLKKYEENYSNIIIIKNIENIGLIGSLNIAIIKASGDYIARMDADDISLANRFELQVKYLNEQNSDLIGSNINFVDEKGIKFAQSDKVLTHKYILKLLESGTIAIVHPTFFGKAAVFKNCFYNENAFYAEDMEFLVHASSRGYILGNCPQVLLNCRYSNSSITKLKTIQMENTVQNIKYSFKMFKKTREYAFLVKGNSVSTTENSTAILIKEYFSNARSNYSEKKYIKMVYFLTKAFISSPSSFINSFRYRALSIYYRFLEKLS
ncbi:glycosyltransferase [Acinetobacter gerneri]|uniref:Glycosyltransferase n=1 Tax=Acinetobacter gerneri TaxID=202952 RepID=A0AAW8JLG5_9GAMM|nr:glycosyltransferase [Acinetobacter gerneri]MDQ9010702.1 glycosyltransferase [Acinetobacter gerneri]MDQ9014866.1 glycosyltransferase [Acinetobacter gerneri]MDQ9026072.1 glycosyltransferase [Acinetobacter gerneri]MDQ9053318.1 glycosyltransferase [Acinetobacter gerneri]MDQ9060937.1 glycosyltransferase [Acinetobacter gerneri]